MKTLTLLVPVIAALATISLSRPALAQPGVTPFLTLEEKKILQHDRTGSHNLVVGHGNSFTSFGGWVGPHDSTVSWAFASVTGGDRNTASGLFASVSADAFNEASGVAASVGGGANRSVSGYTDWRAGSLFEDG